MYEVYSNHEFRVLRSSCHEFEVVDVAGNHIADSEDFVEAREITDMASDRVEMLA